MLDLHFYPLWGRFLCIMLHDESKPHLIWWIFCLNCHSTWLQRLSPLLAVLAPKKTWQFMCLFILQTSSSLKFTVLNPKGRIWTMVAGGGASVIYADTVSFHLSHLLTRSLLLPQPHLVWLVAYSVSDVNLLVLQFRDCHGNLPAYLNKLASFCTAQEKKKKKKNSFFSCYHLRWVFPGWWLGLCIRTRQLCRVQWSSKWGRGFAVC